MLTLLNYPAIPTAATLATCLRGTEIVSDDDGSSLSTGDSSSGGDGSDDHLGDLALGSSEASDNDKD